jgi:hypothetical protein
VHYCVKDIKTNEISFRKSQEVAYIFVITGTHSNIIFP